MSTKKVKYVKRAIAQAITAIENGCKPDSELKNLILAKSGSAHLIGITGPPGVGKSTLIDSLITRIRQDNFKVGVLAVDPSSPFSGGAILGDRIRMQEHTMDNGVFIRSMSNRGYVGGVALAAYDAIRILEAFDYDVIIIETVGVGQSELAIAQMADTTILTLMPGSGDDIQAIKSGIMEIADIFLIGKGDLPGANKAATNILQSLDLISDKPEWMPPVLIASPLNKNGIDELWLNILKHYDFLKSTKNLEKRRKKRIACELSELVAFNIRNSCIDSFENSIDAKSIIDEVLAKKIEPRLAADKLLSLLK